MLSKKRKYTSGKLAEKKKRMMQIRLIIVAVVVILLIAGFSYLSHHKSMKIETVLVEGQEYIQEGEVISLVTEKLKGSYMWLFSRSNIFIYPRGAIRKELQDTFSSIDTVRLRFVNIHTVKVQIEEFQSVATWCNDDSCYFMNEEGMLFVEEPLIHTHAFVKYGGGITDEPLNQTYISKKTFTDLQNFVKLLRRLEIETVSITTENSEEFTITTESGATILIDSNDDVLNVFDNLQTVMTQDAINKAQFKNIEYIDLRFGNRVFYKLK